MSKNGSYVKCPSFKINLKILEIFNILNYFSNKTFNSNRISDAGLTWSILASFWSTKQTLIVIISRSLHVILRSQPITQCMQPAVTLQTLNNHLVILVLLPTHWAVYLTAARATLGVVVLPVTPKPRGGGSTVYTHHTPINEPSEANINHRDYLFKLQK